MPSLVAVNDTFFFSSNSSIAPSSRSVDRGFRAAGRPPSSVPRTSGAQSLAMSGSLRFFGRDDGWVAGGFPAGDWWREAFPAGDWWHAASASGGSFSRVSCRPWIVVRTEYNRAVPSRWILETVPKWATEAAVAITVCPTLSSDGVAGTVGAFSASVSSRLVPCVLGGRFDASIFSSSASASSSFKDFSQRWRARRIPSLISLSGVGV
mmetsp:Transcript_33961/g.76492  ORF Transcript_33961/g.76492 Transcript_33961/m.76492 type:complete len:208 (-) Transcript_33961:790-1413(-)